MAVCGTSGAGKTGLIQPLIRSVLDSGGFAVVFDMGDGYKSLCENMGGVYLDGETLRFNPFANITDIDQSAERVRDQLSVMASPNGIPDNSVQLAFADGDVLVTGEMNESERASFMSTLNKMAEKKKNTGKEMFVGVTRILSDDESKVFFEKVKAQHPEMDIKIPFLTVMETLQYKPAESAARVQCPVLVVIAGQDSVNPPEQGRALYDAVASGTKELYEEADACHYDIYEGAFFERVAAVQTQWFKKYI